MTAPFELAPQVVGWQLRRAVIVRLLVNIEVAAC